MGLHVTLYPGSPTYGTSTYETFSEFFLPLTFKTLTYETPTYETFSGNLLTILVLAVGKNANL